MSAEVVVKDITEIPKNIVKEIESEAKPATKEGVMNHAVGFMIGVPASMLYDYLYELMSEKLITNEFARDLIKVAMPLGIAVVVQVAKVPFGSVIAGTGYAIAVITAARIIYNRIKGYATKENDEGVATPAVLDSNTRLWGVQK
ncbi:unnamed protein product [marine sediment metagenome]|uniref:Uncharacterized protein n=1 Tax=marine sediment metagenome TaxID=412755 RepID=X1GIA5_9ZZZZ